MVETLAQTCVQPAVFGWLPGRLAGRVRAGSLLLVGTAGLIGAAFPRPLEAAGPALLVTAAVLGLPHGAVDHLALGWSRGRLQGARPVVVVAYALSAAAAAGIALSAPLPALLVLLALSAAHFAEGEAGFARLRGSAVGALPAAALGAAVVALPLALRPGAVGSLLTGLDPGLPGVVAQIRVPLLVGTALLVVAGLVQALLRGRGGAAAELAIVVGALLMAPPLLAFSAWFAGWHAPRHLVRMLALEPVGDGPERARRLLRGAVLPTAAALTGLVALYLVAGGLPRAVLVVLLALTVPHAAVVARFGRLGR